MEYFTLALLCLILVLLTVLLFRTKREKDDSSQKLGEEEVFKIRDSVRHDNEESFSRFQSSLDRDMSKVNFELKTMSERVDSRLTKNEVSMNSFMTNVMDRMRKELVELLSKYVEMDKEALDLSLEQDGDQVALMLSIPVIRAKDEEEIKEALAKEDEEKEISDEGEVDEASEEAESSDEEQASEDEETSDSDEPQEEVEEDEKD